MKRPGSFPSFSVRVLLAAGVLGGGCTADMGSRGGDDNGGSGSDNPSLPPPESDEWKRNPEKHLKCEQPLTMNAAAFPLQRLTSVEIENTLRDLLAGIGDHERLGHRYELPAESRVAGFSNNAYQQQADRNFSDAIEQFALTAAEEAVKDLNRLGCANANGSCVESFVRNFGQRAFRRPLSGDEVAHFKGAYDEARGDPYQFDHTRAMATVVGAMLQSPQFLYRIEEGEGEATANGGRALTNWELASRLSYLITDSMPDEELFRAAERRELTNPARLEQHARRLLGSPRARQAVRDFHDEWLENMRYSAFVAASTKDREIFPTYNQSQADALLAGRDRFIEDAFFGGDHSMTRLLTMSKGWVNDEVAYIYGVEPPGSSDLVEVDLDPAVRKGILTNPGFMSGMSHKSETAPILRGGFVMDRILCAPSPPPPDDVVREIPFSETGAITYRERVEITTQGPMAGACRGCHAPLNAFGFLFENYNSIGAYQTEEAARFRGEIFRLPVNSSAEIVNTLDVDGRYDGAIAFVDRLGRSEQVAQCVVENWWVWANARRFVEEDGCAIVPLTNAFIASGFDMQKLVVELVKSPQFRFRNAAVQ